MSDQKKWAIVPPAFGQPHSFTDHPAEMAEAVAAGAEHYNQWLNEPAERPLARWLMLRESSLPWRAEEAFQAGFLARVEQHIRALQAAANHSPNPVAALALGNEVFGILHEATRETARLTARREIRGSSDRAKKHLKGVRHLATSLRRHAPADEMLMPVGGHGHGE